MRAARMHSYGGPEVFRIDTVPDPVPKPNEVLVEIHATSVNPVDFKIRGGYQRALVWPRFPATLGMDLSGVVRAVGSKVSRYAVGDEVYSSPSHFRMGTYAELLCVREDELAPKPKNLSHLEAASIPLVGLTVWLALVQTAELTAGQKILIQAGSGGVGSFAIQLAKSLGAEVWTTCSSRNHPLVKELGADHAIDYRSTRFEDVVEELDVVFDTLGGDYIGRALPTVKAGGHLVTITPNLPSLAKVHGPYLSLLLLGEELASTFLEARLRYGIHFSLVTRKPDGEALAKITRMIELGAIRPVIDKVFPLEEIVEAHRYLETGRARGKVVVSVVDPE